MLRALMRSLGQLVLPAHCGVCGSPAAPDGRFGLCEPCGAGLAGLLQTPHCPRCGRSAGPHTVDLDGCSLCRGKRLPFDGVVRVGPYAEPLRALILAHKYRRRSELGPLLGRLLAERAALSGWIDRVESIVPVPLHWTRRAWRGFNQAAPLGRELVRASPGGRSAAGLLRVRPTPHQTRLPPSRRAANVRGAFGVRGRDGALRGRRVLLVDDVMTSGATLGECARTLRRAGAAEVYVAVVAVAGADETGPW